jgi:hypothetical protein
VSSKRFVSARLARREGSTYRSSPTSCTGGTSTRKGASGVPRRRRHLDPPQGLDRGRQEHKHGRLEALEVVIEIINSNDIMSIEMVLGKESNKQWWPS